MTSAPDFFSVLLPSLRVVSSHVLSNTSLQPKILTIPYREYHFPDPSDIIDADLALEALYAFGYGSKRFLRLWFPLEHQEDDKTLTVYVYEPRNLEELIEIGSECYPYTFAKVLNQGKEQLNTRMHEILTSSEVFRSLPTVVACAFPMPFNVFSALNALTTANRIIKEDRTGPVFCQFVVDNPSSQAAVFALAEPYEPFSYTTTPVLMHPFLPSAYLNAFNAETLINENVIRLIHQKKYSAVMEHILEEQVDDNDLIKEILQFALKPY